MTPIEEQVTMSNKLSYPTMNISMHRCFPLFCSNNLYFNCLHRLFNISIISVYRSPIINFLQTLSFIPPSTKCKPVYIPYSYK